MRLISEATGERGLAPEPARPAVRPGRVELRPAGSDGTLEGRVEKATHVGAHMEYRIRADVGTLFVVSDDVDDDLAIDQAIGVAFGRSGPVLPPARPRPFEESPSGRRDRASSAAAPSSES